LGHFFEARSDNAIIANSPQSSVVSHQSSVVSASRRFN
jgi:hypothetical protein